MKINRILHFLMICTITMQSIIMAQTMQISPTERAQIIEALKNPSWGERSNTLKSLEISHITDLEISSELIRLLDFENKDYLLRRQGPMEVWVEYYFLVINIIGRTGNEQAIPSLVNSIYVGGTRHASEALANFSDKGILALLDALDESRGISLELANEASILRITMEFLESDSMTLLPETMERLKNTIIPLTTNYTLLPTVRKNAVRILGHIDDPEVISHLETLAQSDPYFLPYTIRGIKSEYGGYVIREEAQKQLDKLQKGRKD